MTMIFGYARVSTDGQSVNAQVKQLEPADAAKIFREVPSGATSDRARLCRAFGQLAKNDVLLVKPLDRLARATRDLLNTPATITDRQAGFCSLGDASSNCRKPVWNSMSRKPCLRGFIINAA